MKPATPSQSGATNEEQSLTGILLAASVVIPLLVANIVILFVVLRRTRQRRRPYRGYFSTVETAIGREADKVLRALDASVPDYRALGHWLLAETSDEHTGLLCGIAARPGPARLRIKKAVHERVKKADIRLEEAIRVCLEERPCRLAVERTSDQKIVLLGRWKSKLDLYLEYRRKPDGDDIYFPGAYEFYSNQVEELLKDLKPNDLWQKAYDATVNAKDSYWTDEKSTVVQTVRFYGKELKGIRKHFGDVHRGMFGGNPPLPYSDEREMPLQVSVAEAELAYGIMVEWVWRLARSKRKSRRLAFLLGKMKRMRSATLRAFPAFADALETAATESGACRAMALGEWLHHLPSRVVNAMAECMTNMERNFAAMGVHACIKARVENPHDVATVFDWSFQKPQYADDREPQHPAPAYARTLGSRSFRRKMAVVFEQDIAMNVISAYDDAIAARRLRARVAAACREHGAALIESAEDMAAILENHPYYFTSFELSRKPEYRKMDKHERFRQAVDEAIASALCQEIGPQPEEDASPPG